MKRGREDDAAPAKDGKGEGGGGGGGEKRLKRREYTGVARVVGWGTWEEWRAVRGWLGSSDPNVRQRGLRRIRAWRARAPIPLAIEATAALLETHAMDTFPPTRTTNELRLLYSMTIVRMVNGLVEVEQKGTFARSVLGIAEQLGIPRVLVDLRHTATHNVLPSLSSLRVAAAQALEWLDANYWQEQEDALVETTRRTREMLEQYIALRQDINAHASVLLTREAAMTSCVQALLSQTSSNNAREIVVPMLLKGFLVAPDHVKRLLLVWTSDRNVRALNRNAEFAPIARRWEPLLLACIKKWGHFLGTLLASITNKIVHLSASRKPKRKRHTKLEVWLQWLEHLLYAPQYQNVINEYAIQVPIVALLQTAERDVSSWTNKVSRLLVAWISDPAMKQKMTEMLDIAHPPKRRKGDFEVVPAQPGDLSLEVFESLLSLIKQRGLTTVAPVQGKTARARGPWQRCDDWTPCSVGLSITNEFPNLLLPQEFDYNGAITLVPKRRPMMPVVALPYSAPAKPQSKPAPPPPPPPPKEKKSSKKMKKRMSRDPTTKSVVVAPSTSSSSTTAEPRVGATRAAPARRAPAGERAGAIASSSSSSLSSSSATSTATAALLFSPMELTRL